MTTSVRTLGTIANGFVSLRLRPDFTETAGPLPVTGPLRGPIDRAVRPPTSWAMALALSARGLRPLLLQREAAERARSHRGNEPHRA